MIRRIALSSLRSSAKDSSKIVKYSACSNKIVDDDLDEVAVISSNAAPESVRYGSGGHSTANGPRVVPGIITAGVDRSKLVQPSCAQRKPSSVFSGSGEPTSEVLSDNQDGARYYRQTSQQSGIYDRETGGGPEKICATTGAIISNGSNTDGFLKSGPDLEVTKKTREQRRREIKKEFEKWENANAIHHKSGCNWSFVFDPSGRLCYYWSLIVSIAFLYNFWTIIYRCAFQEINEKTMATWFALDYFSDFIYVLDIAVNFRTGYLEEGVLQTDSVKLRQHYMNCTIFYIDCLCLLPLDFLYLSIGFKSILRCFRLIKIYRFWAFLDRTERHTNYPNIFRTLSLLHYILAIFHWNACLSHIIHIKDGFGSRDWFTGSKNKDCDGVTCDYLHAVYWSVLALTTIGDLPTPRTKSEYLFLIMQLVFGLFLFATVLGHVANIVTNVSAARKEFQAKLDAVKTYMRMRRVPDHIQTKVIRWFDYLWMTQKSSDEERSVGCLPDKLKAEIAIHVHLDTLKRVEIFQNTEAGFLCELVLRLRPVLFSPGDYICRKGEVGKEMYIVNRGRLQVVTDNGKTVLATLRAGSYFGEISILNMGTAGNRRTASVRSVGYSDLFCLNKQDMWDVLKDYPAARVRLEAIAVKRLEKYRKEPLKKIAMGRSKSTPGLVESKGKIPVPDALQYREVTSASTATLLKDDEPAEDEERNLGGGTAKPQLNDCEAGVNSTASSVDTMKAGSSSKEASCESNTAGGICKHRSQPPASPLLSSHQTAQPLIYSHLLSPNLALVNLDTRSPQPQPSPTNLYTTAHCPPGTTAAFFHHSTLSPQPQQFCTISPAVSTNHLAPVFSSTTPNPDNPDGAGNSAYSSIQVEFPTQDALLSEIKRLRERLLTLETENASMSMKLNQQQWQVENRLAEIELQINSAASANSAQLGVGGGGFLSSNSSNTSAEDNERNKESII